MKRTFIAINIDLSPELIQKISQLKSSLKDEKIRWVSSENMHLTLKFFGDLSNIQIETVKKALSVFTVNRQSFSFKLKGLSYFGKRKNPAVVFIDIERDEQLRECVADLVSLLVNFGFEDEKRNFSPHLTLGRMKFIKDKNHFFDVLEELNDDVQQTVNVEEIILYESILKPAGPQYVALANYMLK